MIRTNDALMAGLLAFGLAACGGAETEGDAVVPTPASPAEERAAAPADAPDDAAPANDIITVAEADGRFTTLLAAVEAAGLADTLRRGDYTLLAPTDDAFANLPEGTVEVLLDPENRDELVTVLQYHVLDAPVRSGDIDGVVEAPTLAGDALMVERVGERVLIGGQGGAVVTDADIAAEGSVIHVIDSVLIPPAG